MQPIIKKVDPGSMAEMSGLVPGDIVLSVNGVSGLSNFQVVEMLRKGQGVFTLVVISGQQVQSSLVQQSQTQQQMTTVVRQGVIAPIKIDLDAAVDVEIA